MQDIRNYGSILSDRIVAKNFGAEMTKPIYQKKKGMATVNPLLQQNIYSSNGKFIGLTDG